MDYGSLMTAAFISLAGMFFMSSSAEKFIIRM